MRAMQPAPIGHAALVPPKPLVQLFAPLVV
jgi:hypothetical protein